jgi:hypothetical protein
MRAFLAGMAVALALALGSGFALQLAAIDTATALAPDSVRL